MKSDAESFLGISEGVSKPSAKSYWWIASLAAPFLALVTIYLFLIAENPNLGISLALIFLSPAIAGVLSIIITTIAFIKREPCAPLGLILAIPTAGYLCWYVSHIQIPESQKTKIEYAKLYETIRHDPEISIRERWYASKWYSSNPLRRRVFIDSLKDPSVPYTLQLIKRLYQEAPKTRDFIFYHPACDSTFLQEHFQEAFDRAIDSKWEMLVAIVSNPNTPDELLTRVATAERMPGIASLTAQSEIARRQNEEIDAALTKLRSNPNLIANEQFWKEEQKDTNQSAYKALLILIKDQNYRFPPNGEEVVLKEFPYDPSIYGYVCSTRIKDHPEIIADEAFWKEQENDTNHIARNILARLLDDQTYSLPAHGKEVLLKEFSNDPVILRGVKFVTRPMLPEGHPTNVHSQVNPNGSMVITWDNTPDNDPRDTNPTIFTYIDKDGKSQILGSASAGARTMYVPPIH